MARCARALCTFLILTLLDPVAAGAHEFDLLWNDCAAGGGDSDLSGVDCGVDTGDPLALIVSLTASGPIDLVVGVTFSIQFGSDADLIPDWWRLDLEGCRGNSLSFQPAVGTGGTPPFGCTNAWAGQGFGNVQFVLGAPPPGGTGQAALRGIVAVAAPLTLEPSQGELYVARISIDRAQTTSCSGCDVAACMALTDLRIARTAQAPGGDVFVFPDGANDFVTYRGGGSIDCPAAVPTKVSTWGRVKSLYR